MRVARLSENLEKCGIGDEEKSRKQQALLLQIPGERFLADLELLEYVRQQLRQRVVAGATLDDVRNLVRSLHDAQPRLVDVRKPLCLLSTRHTHSVSAVHLPAKHSISKYLMMYS